MISPDVLYGYDEIKFNEFYRTRGTEMKLTGNHGNLGFQGEGEKLYSRINSSSHDMENGFFTEPTESNPPLE